MAGMVNRSSVRLQITSIGRHSPHKLLKHPRYVASRKGNLLHFFKPYFYIFLVNYKVQSIFLLQGFSLLYVVSDTLDDEGVEV